MAAIAKAIGAIKGTAQQAQVAKELLKQECRKKLEEQETEDAAFIQQLIEQEEKAQAKAKAKAASAH
jgi:hypothetical protein